MVLPLLPLGVAFALVALGEMGDKTQLLVVSLAARYSRWAVLAGAIVAEVAMAALGVTAGHLLVDYIPIFWITLASGLGFVALGIPILVRRETDDAPGILANMGHRGVMLSTLGIIAVGELGDKTQLAIVALSAQYQAPLAVFVGAVLGEVLMMVLGVALGDQLSRRIHRRYLRILSGTIFIVVGVVLVVGAVLGY